MDSVVPLRAARDAKRFGHKAANLAWLGDVAGVRVPDGFALDAAAFERTVQLVLAPSQWPERVLGGDASARSAHRLASIRTRLMAASLPEGLRGEIVEAWRAMGSPSVAVRSSALHEDSGATSAAGLQETVLGVTDEAGLVAAVLRCWASMYGERAAVYLGRLKGVSRYAMAVVVQRMVRADAAGVVFTADPVSGDRAVMVVESAPGLGVSVVDGATAPDVFRLDAATGAVRTRRVSEKRGAVRVDGHGGVVEVALSPAQRAQASVDDATLAALVTLGRDIAARGGCPQDIEWALEDGALWVLQARPVVGMSSTSGDLDDRATWIWSNVNVGEALPGVATPLTWSIAAAFSDKGFRRAFASLGCEVSPGAELVGNFHGRIYLNLTNFMRIARQVPLLSARTLIEFGGGSGVEEVERQVPRGRWAPFLLRLPGIGVRQLVETASLDGRLQRFEAAFTAGRARIESLALTPLSLLSLRDELRARMALLDTTGELMLSCASGYLASVVGLRTLLQQAVPREAERYERELTVGFADLESAAPGIALTHIAEIARREPAARAVLEARDAASLSVNDLPDGPTRRAFASFLHAYGFRCPREAELSTPRWREAPGSLFAALKAHLAREARDTSAQVERQSSLRAQAEASLLDALPPVAASATRHLLARIQRFARLRERMRARVTEALGFLRAVAVEASARLRERDAQVGDDAAFYLSVEELDQWLGSALDDPRGLVVTRRGQVMRDRARPDPPSMFVGSPPTAQPLRVPEGARFTGVAASPGVVTGVVRVLRDPADGASLAPGEVLVTSVADVGWTPLFLVAAAVVTELGGALSHAALVAREYGVPAVVNVAGVASALRTGDRVRVDGDRGVVERCEAVADERAATVTHV